MSASTIVFGAAMAQKPRHGGHTWVVLQYLLGFKRLGWDVVLLDRLPVDPTEHEQQVAACIRTLRAFGLQDNFALLCPDSSATIGLDRQHVLERVRGSELLLNVMGFVNDPEILACAPRRVFLDIDPGFPQMWRELGLHDAFAGHDAFVTIGENIGRADCVIPTCGLDWITTPQPIVLGQWPPSDASPPLRFTSVVTWRGAYGPVEYAGQTYGLRAHEFRKFVEVPRRSGLPFELALDIHPDETRDLILLERGGWSLLDPQTVAGDPWDYRAFVGASAAEFMTAKHMYVATRSGWFSDRSLCYLATGKPVLAQDTGFSDRYPTDCGLVAFSTVDEAVAGAQSIVADYPRHARAARTIAAEYFDSDKVLQRLLGKLGVA